MNDPIHQISLYLDNALEPEQLEALLRWVEASPENAELFTQVAMFDSDLREELGIINQIQPVPALEDFQADRHELNADFRGPRDLEAAGVRPRRLMLAAMLLIAGTLGLLIFSPGPGQAPQPSVAEREPILDPGTAAPRPVASVLRVSGTDAASGLAVGTQLTPGRYELLQGFIEVGMQRGATVIVQAPCRFELIDDNQLYLAYGRLTADVPEAARLFTVQTPSMKLVDLGTRFGASVQENGSATAAVFEGEIIAEQISSDLKHADDSENTRVVSHRLKASDAIHASLLAGIDERPHLLEPDHGFLPTWRDLTGRVQITGQARFFVQPPADIGPNALIDPEHMILFQEQTTVLDAPIQVMAELSENAKRPAHALVPAGTRVISYMLHFSPALFTPGPDGKVVGEKQVSTVNATIEFPGRVLGLINGGEDMADTHQSLGLDSVTYMDPNNTIYNNAIDSWPGDGFKITGEKQNILEIHLGALVHSDQARVLVEVPAD